MLYIVDTYAWIEYFTGTPKGEFVKKILENEKNAFITLENCIAELNQWCLKEGKDFDKVILTIRNYSSIESIKIDDWIDAAGIRHEKLKHVKDFGLMDAIILAKQSRLKCKIITGDKHFIGLKEVEFLE